MNSVQAATTSGPPTAVIGLSLRSRRPGDEVGRAHGDEHRHQRQQRAHDAAQPDGEEDADEERSTGRSAALRLPVRFSSRPTPTTARPDGVALTPSGGCRVVADLVDDDLALLERAGAVAVDEVQRARLRSGRRRLRRGRSRARRSTGGCPRAPRRRRRARRRGDVHDVGAGHLDQVVHRWSTRLDAPSSCSGWRVDVATAVMRARRSRRCRLREHVVGSARRCRARSSTRSGASTVAEVLDGLRVLVDPLDRVALQRDLVLDGEAAEEDGEAGDGQHRAGPQRAGCRA